MEFLKFEAIRRKLFLLALVVMAMIISCISFGAEGVILERTAEWSYSDRGEVSPNWKNVDFDDSSWKKGKSPLGYGDDVSETDINIPIGTVVGFGKDDDKYITTYFRKKIKIENTDNLNDVEVFIHVDDGAVVYINGVEAFRKGITDGEVKYSTTGKFKPKEESFKIAGNLFKKGENIIAAEVHQDGPNSSDLWFELGMKLSGAAEIKKEAVKIEKTTKIEETKPNKVSKVTITFTGDTETTKGFTWYTSYCSKKSDIQVVEKTGNIVDFANAMKFRGYTTIPTNTKDEYMHKAEATGLKPGTKYMFRVGDEMLNLWSETGSFVTSSGKGKFTFIDIADTQAKSEDEALLSAKTLKKAVETLPEAEFMIHNGDIVDTGMNELQWDWLLNNSSPTLLNITFAPVAGNHEEEKDAFIEHFNVKDVPGSDTRTGVYYSYNYKNAHFIMLNTNEDSKEFNNFTKEQIEWMKKDAEAAKKKGAKWIIVTMHKGPYTTSNHATDADIMGENGVRTKIVPILNQIGADLVFQGHDHIYARTKVIKDGKVVKTAEVSETINGITAKYKVNPNGTIYLIPSTAGPKVYYKNKKIDSSYYELFDKAEEHSAAKYGADPKDSSRPVRSQIQNFCAVIIEENKLTVTSYEIDKDKNNEMPYIIDSFGIIKK